MQKYSNNFSPGRTRSLPSRAHPRIVAATASYSALIQILSSEPQLYQVAQFGLYGLVLLALLESVVNSRIAVGNWAIALIALAILYSQFTRVVASLALNVDLFGRDVLVVPLLMTFIGVNGNLSERETRFTAVVYGASTAVAGWTVIYLYRDTAAFEGAYFFAQKNQVGALLGAAIALLLYVFWRSAIRATSTSRGLAVSALLIAINFLALLEIRSRSAIVGVSVLLLLLFLKSMFSADIGAPGRVRIGLGAALVSLLAGPQIVSAVHESIFLGYDATDINAVSANRVDVYLQSLRFSLDNFLWGELVHDSSIFDPHNFLLYHIQNFGFVLSIGYIVVYVVIVVLLVKQWIGTPLGSMAAWAFLFTVSVFTSFLEYAQPFGPGSTQLIAWYLFGRALGNESERA